MNNNWVPPKSPHGLIQEDLWPDRWKMLVSCLMLNLTTRKQVDGVIHEFFHRYPSAGACARANPTEMEELLRPLGMQHKRARTLVRFSQEFLAGFDRARDLYGVGKYADDSDRIFFLGKWREVEPHDHALCDYHNWLKETSV